ncbi:MAG: hypothetical protein P3B98_12820 [Gemmatimonadota bacterium]|nr:hypothetical protein [Gemmatimonadota bacterium]
MTPIRSLLILLMAAPLAAQTPLLSDATVRMPAGGNAVAILKKGTEVTVGGARGDYVYVSFTGWLDGSKLGAAKDSFPAQLTGDIGMRLRSAPSMKGEILGEVRPGAGLFTMGKQASWANVRRGGWVDAKAVAKDVLKASPAAPVATKPATKAETPAKPAAKPVPAAPKVAEKATPARAAPAKTAPAKVAPAPVEPAPPIPEPEPVIEAAPDGAMRMARTAVVRNAPNGLVLGQLGGGTVVEPLARTRGWVRVRTDVWVPERDVVPADASYGATLSAADLRADPEGTRGKTVRWEVQVLALQYADPLRRDLAQDEPYFLAKGPGAEDQLLYLAIPPSLLNEARSTQALTRVLITARVRTGRSQPVGIPILDILSLAKQ